MEQQDRPARAWAQELVEAWIDGRPAQPILDQIPPARVGLARDMARSTCERLLFWARRVQAAGIDVVPLGKGSTEEERQALRRLVARVVQRMAERPNNER